jgi:hypothetical protein
MNLTPAAILRYGELQIVRRAKLIKVLLKEAIFAVVDWRTLAEAQQHLVGQDWCTRRRCGGCRRES